MEKNFSEISIIEDDSILQEQSILMNEFGNSEEEVEKTNEVQQINKFENKRNSKLNQLNFNLVNYFSQYLLLDDLFDLIKVNKRIRDFLVEKNLLLMKFVKTQKFFKTQTVFNSQDLLSANFTNFHLLLEEIFEKLCLEMTPKLVVHLIGQFISTKIKEPLIFSNLNDIQLTILNFLSEGSSKKCPVKSLCLKEFPIENIASITKFLTNSKLLTRLTLSKLEFNTTHLFDFFDSVGSHPSLEDLAIYNTCSNSSIRTVYNDNLESLLFNLKKAKKLTTLSLNFSKLDFLKKLLKDNNSLKNLQLVSLKETSNSLNFDFLAVTSNLETLHLYNSHISQQSLQNLCLVLTSPPIKTKIRSLIFNSTLLTDFNVLSFVININPQITRIEIREQEIKLPSVKNFLKSLVHNKSLKSLVLHSIDKEVFNNLLIAIAKNDCLEEIDLTQNYIKYNDELEIPDIKTLLESNKVLKLIRINQPKILAERVAKTIALKEIEKMKNYV